MWYFFGRSPYAVRRQMLRPLNVAGLCVEATQDRKVVIGISKNIETDTGGLTTHIVEDLHTHLGWNRKYRVVSNHLAVPLLSSDIGLLDKASIAVPCQSQIPTPPFPS